MPTYVYKCDCTPGQYFEIKRGLTEDEPNYLCPFCQEAVDRVYTVPQTNLGAQPKIMTDVGQLSSEKSVYNHRNAR